MQISFDHPNLLWGLFVLLLPLLQTAVTRKAISAYAVIPADLISSFINVAIHLAGIMAFASMVIGMAAPFITPSPTEEISQGAHIVLLLDRSSSMDNTFAGRPPDGNEESKSHAAKRLLKQFIRSERSDQIGVVGFSTSAFFMLPLSNNKNATLAAIDTMDNPGLAYTNVSKGLAMALDFFDSSQMDSSRVILLVSDGAAAVDPSTQQQIEAAFIDRGIRLYWIFLRTAGSPGIFFEPEKGTSDTPARYPERHLHLFFSHLGIPYQAFEAENSASLEQAIKAIERSEDSELIQIRQLPRQSIATYFYWIGVLCLTFLLLIKLYEIKTNH